MADGVREALGARWRCPSRASPGRAAAARRSRSASCTSTRGAVGRGGAADRGRRRPGDGAASAPRRARSTSCAACWSRIDTVPYEVPALPWQAMHGCVSSSAIRCPRRSGSNSHAGARRHSNGPGAHGPFRHGNLHLTVAFLGWIASVTAAGVAAVVREESAGVCATALCRASGTARRASVGMVVFRDPTAPGRAGGRHPGAAGGAWRLRAGAAPWLPHVTVARWKERPTRVRTYVPVMEIVPSEIAVYLLSCASAERSTTFSNPPR